MCRKIETKGLSDPDFIASALGIGGSCDQGDICANTLCANIIHFWTRRSFLLSLVFWSVAWGTTALCSALKATHRLQLIQNAVTQVVMSMPYYTHTIHVAMTVIVPVDFQEHCHL